MGQCASRVENAIAIDENDAFALEGLSSIYRRKKLNQETADMALRAVGLLHRLPMAHFNLGVAMARSGEPERAILAFETALRFQPKWSTRIVIWPLCIEAMAIRKKPRSIKRKSPGLCEAGPR